VYCPEGVSSKYLLIVFDESKEAFIPLTEFYHDQVKRISESSVVAYLNTLEPFFYWLKHKSRYKERNVLWDVDRVRQRYMQLTKPELVDLLIRMEQYIAYQNQHWLKYEFEKFNK
jgi:hypothetical protein